MKYRRVGATQLELPEIGVGCGDNAGLMIRGDRREQIRVVARALELGVTYFDIAPAYGEGAAETNLGRALGEIRQRPLLNSKVAVRPEHLGDIAGHVVASVEASLKRLGVDYLDVLQIHNAPSLLPPAADDTTFSQLWIEDFLEPGGAVDGLLRLKRDGKVRYIGIVSRGNDRAAVQQLLDTGMFSLVNVAYNLINPSAGRACPDGLRVMPDFGGILPEAAARGAGSAVYSPLACGVLTDAALAGAPSHAVARRETMPARKAGGDLARARALEFLARETGMSLAQAAFRFILDHPATSVAVGGFSSVEQLEEIAAVPDLPGISPALMARLDAVWRSNFGL